MEDPPPEVSPPGEPTACRKCGDALLAHMRAAAGKLSSRLRVHERKVMDLLRLWWHTALLWIWDKPLAPEVKRADLQLLHEVLHELAVHGPPEDASSPVLGEGRKVSVQLAAKGLGNAGSMQVPPTLWEQCADPCFEWARRNAPTQPHSATHDAPRRRPCSLPWSARAWWRAQGRHPMPLFLSSGRARLRPPSSST